MTRSVTIHLRILNTDMKGTKHSADSSAKTLSMGYAEVNLVKSAYKA